MRQGQHSKKNRGRNRRQSNPGSRVFESNGPDVKIRGNASHVSEKYLALARDAQAAGDPIGSENYLQHAEHYLRIIAAAQAHQASQNSPCAPERSEKSSDGDGSAQSRGRGRGNGDGRDAEQDPAASADENPSAEMQGANGSDADHAAGDGGARRRRGRKNADTANDDNAAVAESPSQDKSADVAEEPAS